MTSGVVIPSYNEHKNLSVLVQKIFTLYPQTYIVIVDDSPKKNNLLLEKSLQSVRRKFKDRITLLSRYQKLGRGSAVMTGLKTLLQNKKINYFFEMDADLSHDSLEFPLFIRAMQKKRADMIIGSRYLRGSNIVDWPLWRIILSRGINGAINVLLGLSIHDYTNGFRLYSRRAVTFLSTIQLREHGFIMLSEIAYRLHMHNMSIAEIPISFIDRKHGSSSADAKEFISAFIGLIRIRFLKFQ